MMHFALFAVITGCQIGTSGAMMMQPSHGIDVLDDSDAHEVDAKEMAADDLTAFGSEFVHNSWSLARPHIILGIGFPKCGSHHSWEVLAKHPQVLPGPLKEMMYFEWPTDNEQNACHAGATPDLQSRLNEKLVDEAKFYAEACFGEAGKRAAGVPKDGKPKKMLLEYSPGYTAFPPGPKQDTVFRRIAAVNANATLRMIALLRNPVDRAASEINMFRANGRVNGTDEELSEKLRMQQTADTRYHVGAGMYGQRLNEWLTQFHKKQILVVNTAALDKVETWIRVFRHVGLPAQSPEWIQQAMDAAAKHTYQGGSTYLHLNESARTDLQAYYSGDGVKLWQLLGLSKPWW